MTWTNNITGKSTNVHKVDFDELRTTYKSIEGSVSFTTAVNYTFTNGTTTTDKGPHVLEMSDLRTAINNLQSLFSNNCCQSNCCQTCQTSSCQTTSCQSCQSCQSNCCGATCFPADTLVLMGDFSWKPIEEIKAGEYVMGMEGLPLKVQSEHKVVLGTTRVMWEFMDHSLKFSGEHPFWTKQNGVEWWGVFDIHQHIREDIAPPITGSSGFVYNVHHLSENPLILTGGEEFAHIKGWKVQDARILRDQLYPRDYPLYALVTEGSHTFIANGYVVSAFAHDTGPDGFNYETIDWKGLKKTEV